MQGPMYFEFYFFSLIESPLQIFVVVLTKDSNHCRICTELILDGIQ